MPKGFNVKQPLSVDNVGGNFRLTTEARETISQNLKFLILTAPGERIRFPNFGVGLRRYLFESDTPELESALREKIYEQAGTYMPYITIREIAFDRSNIDSNQLGLTISYFTNDSSRISDILSLSVTI